MNIAYAMGDQGATASGGIQWMSFLPLLVVVGAFIALGIWLGRKKNSGLTCRKCNIVYSQGEKFCKKCGNPLTW